MPLYVYKCPRCNAVAEVQRKIADRDEPLVCASEECERGTYLSISFMRREPTAPSGVFPGAASWRS